jgi:hypothetical protein
MPREDGLVQTYLGFPICPYVLPPAAGVGGLYFADFPTDPKICKLFFSQPLFFQHRRFIEAVF